VGCDFQLAAIVEVACGVASYDAETVIQSVAAIRHHWVSVSSSDGAEARVIYLAHFV